MKLLDKTYPVETHPSWEIHDASKLQTSMRCLRKYFYEYVLGWRTDRVNIHLIFGEAWHRGMEVLLRCGYTQDAVVDAMVVFEQYYRQFFREEDDEENYPKVPGSALINYMQYIKEFKDDEVRYKTLFTEVAGPVNITDDEVLHFRLDSVMEDLKLNKIFSFEHKTASTNSSMWRSQWEQKMQLFLYTHALYCYYGYTKVDGVIVNGSFFYKSQKPANIRIPVRKRPDSMREWLTIVTYYLDVLKYNFNILSEKDKPENDVMFSFPKNTEACTDYGGCPFADLCIGWTNPLKFSEKVPLGYKIERWNPMDREKDARYKFKDGKIVAKTITG